MGESWPRSCVQTSLRSVCTYDLGQDSPIQTSCSVNKSYIFSEKVNLNRGEVACGTFLQKSSVMGTKFCPCKIKFSWFKFVCRETWTKWPQFAMSCKMVTLCIIQVISRSAVCGLQSVGCKCHTPGDRNHNQIRVGASSPSRLELDIDECIRFHQLLWWKFVEDDIFTAFFAFAEHWKITIILFQFFFI